MPAWTRLSHRTSDGQASRSYDAEAIPPLVSLSLLALLTLTDSSGTPCSEQWKSVDRSLTYLVVGEGRGVGGKGNG